MIIVKNEVANDWRGDQAGECEDVWDGVDIFVRRELG
jgi:hypothetical protein